MNRRFTYFFAWKYIKSPDPFVETTEMATYLYKSFELCTNKNIKISAINCIANVTIVIYPKSSKILYTQVTLIVANNNCKLKINIITVYPWSFWIKIRHINNNIYDAIVEYTLIEKISLANWFIFSLSFLYFEPSRTA